MQSAAAAGSCYAIAIGLEAQWEEGSGDKSP